MERASLSVGQRLEQERLNRGWTQEQVAEQIGVDLATYRRWERDRHKPQRLLLQKLCMLFGMSAQALGFGEEEDQVVAAQNVTVERDTTGNTYQAVRRYSLFMRLYRLVWNYPMIDARYQELQAAIALELEDNSMNGDDSMSRREALEALRNLAMLAIEGCSLSALQPVYTRPIAEILTQCAAGVTACWYLHKGKDLAFAYDVVAKYLPTLKDIVKTAADQQRKEAADLVVQCLLLQSTLAKHFQSNDRAVTYAKEAEIYSRTAENTLLEVLALRTRAAAHFYGNQWAQAVQAAEEARSLLKTAGKKTESGVAKKDVPLPPAIESYVYVGLATYQSHEGQKQDALASLKKAHTLFFAQSVDEPLPIWVDHSQANLILNDGMTYYHLGLYKEAFDSFQQAVGIDDGKTVIRVEAAINQVMAEIYRDDRPRDMQTCIDLWTKGIEGAKALKSKQRYHECILAYTAMRAAWPQEQRIKDLYGYLAR